MGVVKDAGTVTKIALAVLSLFTFNDVQKKTVDDYVKNNMYTWISDMRREEEVEAYIRGKANEVSK